MEGWGYFQEIMELGYEFDIVLSHLQTTFRDEIYAAVSLFSWPRSLSPWIKLRSAPIQLQDLVLLHPLSTFPYLAHSSDLGNFYMVRLH